MPRGWRRASSLAHQRQRAQRVRSASYFELQPSCPRQRERNVAHAVWWCVRRSTRDSSAVDEHNVVWGLDRQRAGGCGVASSAPHALTAADVPRARRATARASARVGRARLGRGRSSEERTSCLGGRARSNPSSSRGRTGRPVALPCSQPRGRGVAERVAFCIRGSAAREQLGADSGPSLVRLRCTRSKVYTRLRCRR